MLTLLNPPPLIMKVVNCGHVLLSDGIYSSRFHRLPQLMLLQMKRIEEQFQNQMWSHRCSLNA